MALPGGIQRRHLPGQIVIPPPGGELVDAHRHNPRKVRRLLGGQPQRPAGLVQKVCRTSDLEIGRGYANTSRSWW